jgi:hypothetical protein
MTSETVVSWTKHVLVVANVTAASDELRAALEALAREQPTAFTLIVPATPSERDGAADRERLSAAVERLRAAGLQVEGRIADSDPIVAVSEAWDPRRYDEIVVSTLPMHVSKWLHAGLPKRIGDLTGALVTHVISEPRPRVENVPPPPREKSALGPLSVLGWGGHSGRSGS